MPKTDGTILKISVTLEQDGDDCTQIYTSFNRDYCDDDFKDWGTIYLLAIAQAVKEITNQANGVKEDD